MKTLTQHVTLNNVTKTANLLEDIVLKTPLQKNQYMSDKHSANIVFKREDLQEVRSYKIRGAYKERAASIMLTQYLLDLFHKTVFCPFTCETIINAQGHDILNIIKVEDRVLIGAENIAYPLSNFPCPERSSN